MTPNDNRSQLLAPQVLFLAMGMLALLGFMASLVASARTVPEPSPTHESEPS